MHYNSELNFLQKTLNKLILLTIRFFELYDIEKFAIIFRTKIHLCFQSPNECPLLDLKKHYNDLSKFQDLSYISS